MKRLHILNLLVKDEPGTLIRIAGLIWRRGFNIDTITVGKTEIQKVSRIVISLNADEHIVEQVKKQVSKLADVIKVSELKPDESVIGELCYLKIELSKEKEEIFKQIEASRAELVHEDLNSLVVLITGSSEKIDSFISRLSKYKINVARTGLTGIGK